MKKSEIINILWPYLQKNRGSGISAHEMAEDVLQLLEDAGMLPPFNRFAARTILSAHPANYGYSWEPESQSDNVAELSATEIMENHKDTLRKLKD